MFERRLAPAYLPLGALAFAVWTAFAIGWAPASMLGWTLAGMVALFAVAMLIDRTRSPRSVAHVLEEATQVNAARTAAPRGARSAEREDPRR